MKEISLAYFDFDGCLGNTPHPSYGKELWSEYHETPYPHKGWWGRLESMDLDAFAIRTNTHMHTEWKRLHGEGYITNVLTSRQPKFKDLIQTILDNNNVTVEEIFTVKGQITKGERMVIFVKEWIDKGYTVKNVIFFDDRMKEIVTAEAVQDEMKSLGVNFKFVKIESDADD